MDDQSNRLRAMAILVGLLVACAPVGKTMSQQSPWSFSGELGLQQRWFSDEPSQPGQKDGPAGSLAAQIEVQWFGVQSRARFEPFLRLDSTDSKRTHFDLREAYWAYEGDGWEILAGLNRVFWGVTESRHLVDIINQDDLVEDIDREQKLGQPMILGALQRDWGLLEFYVLPYFREQTFPGNGGRLRTPLVVDTDAAHYESAAGQHHTDLALRWSHYFGDIDIGAYIFHGTGREPLLRPQVHDQNPILAPLYHQITQFGLDLQYTRNAWLWKLEAIGRAGLEDDFFAAVAGFEYTLFAIGKSSSDLGLLVEYLHDERGPGEPQTVFDDDIFFGARWALNDTQDTSVLGGIVFDATKSEWFFNLEAERRIGEHLVSEARVRLFNGRADGQLSYFDREDYVEISLSRHF